MMRVLLIEDSVTDMEMQVRTLTLGGFVVSTAANGKLGLALAFKELPDIIVCDLCMTNGNGYWLADECKRSALLRDIPLVAITGQSGPMVDALALSEVGYDHVMKKPLSITVFLTIIAELCIK